MALLICYMYTNAYPLTSREFSVRATKTPFSTYSGAYGSHTIGHSVGPLVHCYRGRNYNENLGFHLEIQPAKLGFRSDFRVSENVP